MNQSEEFTTLVLRFSDVQEPQRRIAVFEYVRDIAYGDIGARNPLDVLQKRKGTCSGKHALLKLLLESLDYEVQSWFAKHNFGDFPIQEWPEELQIFKGKQITDYHDFLKVKIGNQWVTIDAIFDIPLKKLGFPVQSWDGESDMKLPVRAEEIFKAEGDMEEHKKKLIGALPEEKQKERKAFLSTLTTWLDTHRR